jgi:hypothetical protein
VTLVVALKKALAIVRCDNRAAYLQSWSSRYRLVPSVDHSRGYLMSLSVRYNNEWQPWSEVDHFGIDDILYDKWQVMRL